MKIKDIAAICHEANKQLCESQGDFSQPSWEDAPQWQRNSAIAGVEFHVSCNVRPVPPSSSHESWLRQKEAEAAVVQGLALRYASMTPANIIASLQCRHCPDKRERMYRTQVISQKPKEL